jgi:hypothetical protein
MIYNTIDGVNYVRRELPTADGVKHLEGITVRALLKILHEADPDAMVLYMAEGAPLGVAQDLIFGCIGGAATTGGPAMVVLVGPEAAGALKAFAMEELG